MLLSSAFVIRSRNFLHFLMCSNPCSFPVHSTSDLPIFFISLCVAIIAPVQCIRHPSRMLTTQMYRNVLCWQSVHYNVMVVYTLVSAMSMLLLFFVACIWATRRFPQPVLVGSLQFLHRHRFLFLRFRASCYGSGLWLLVRSPPQKNHPNKKTQQGVFLRKCQVALPELCVKL